MCVCVCMCVCVFVYMSVGLTESPDLTVVVISTGSPVVAADSKIVAGWQIPLM